MRRIWTGFILTLESHLTINCFPGYSLRYNCSYRFQPPTAYQFGLCAFLPVPSMGLGLN